MGKSETNVRNSQDFTEFMRTQRIKPNEILISFDVVSFFTKIPRDLAINVAHRKLEHDSSLSDRTMLSVDDVVQLLEFCLNATYLTFRDQVFQQVHGMAMGSPVSVVIANMVMENVEERALTTFDKPPVFWKRYVDNVCCVVMSDWLERFHRHINEHAYSLQLKSRKKDNYHFWMC